MSVEATRRRSNATPSDPASAGGATSDKEKVLLKMLQVMTKMLEQLFKSIDAGGGGGGGSDRTGSGGDAPCGGPPAGKAPEGGPGAGKTPEGKPEAGKAPENERDAGKAPEGQPNAESDTGKRTSDDVAGKSPNEPKPGASDFGPLSKDAQKSANTSEETSKVSEQYIGNLQADFGLTREQAIGIVANLSHESLGMNSGITQGGGIGSPSSNMNDDNANGYGIAQWGGSRKEALIAFAKENGLDPSSQAANYGFLKQELSGEYKGAIDAVKNTDSSQDATQAFCKAFEKPSDPQMELRLQIARELS
jgi:Phage tail lysozyme